MKSTFSLLLLLCISSELVAQDTLSIYFSHDSEKIGRINKAIISKTLGNKLNLKISKIIGYTSDPGTKSYNLKLADRRIQSTITFIFRDLDIDTSLIKKETFGEVVVSSKNKALDRKTLILFKHDGEKKDLNQSLKSLKIGGSLKLANLNFEPGLDIVLPESINKLKELLDVLLQNKNLKIEIQGHICCDVEDSEDLSTARAKRVNDYLVSKGINQNRLKYIGLGATRPIHSLPEKNDSERIANRRVEIKLLSK